MLNLIHNRHIGGFGTLSSWPFDILNFLSLSQSFGIAFHIVCMDKNVFAAIVRGNKTKTFLCVKEFDCSCRFLHVSFLFFNSMPCLEIDSIEEQRVDCIGKSVFFLYFSRKIRNLDFHC